MRRVSIGVLFAGMALALLVAGAAAQAPQSYSLPSADIAIDVQPDGSLAIDERLEVAFSGVFRFGYRDIPLRSGESLSAPAVAEDGVAYTEVARSDLAPGEPGTFGVRRTADGVRIVWYFDARDETRAFTVSYTLGGVAVGYDDVVDVNLKVWGDQWAEPLASLTAVEAAPGKIERAWAKPTSVSGSVELEGNRATLRASRIPANQYVELRTVIARSAFTSTDAMRVKQGAGLPAILAQEASAKVKPVIGKPVTRPKVPTAGKRFTVSFKVTRSDNGKPLTTGKMVAHPFVGGKMLRHSESFKKGIAGLSLKIPKAAKGKRLKIAVRVTANTKTATKAFTFRIR